jgi:diguanylate cyclase (GGDEF)-like protein
VLAVLAAPLTSSIVVRFVLLLGLSSGYAELGQRSERIRRYLSAGGSKPCPNPLSVWSFAALLTMPAGWAAAFIAVQYAHAIVQRWREQTSKPHRQVLVAAAAMLAQLAAAAVLLVPVTGGLLGGKLLPSLGVLAAAVVFVTVDLALVLTAMCLVRRPPTVRMVLPDADEVGYEAASIAMGIGVAALVVHAPWLTPVMLVPVAYLHRSAMVKSLHHAARTDSKTGLLNSTAWAEHAKASLARCARARRQAAVLVVYIDGFKAVNDSLGHLAGDRLLIAVATCLRSQLRAGDGVGRFGGDEFVVVLEEVDLIEARLIADRLHAALAAVRVDDVSASVSVGVAHTGAHGHQMDDLLQAADKALYTAKQAGRARVHLASDEAPTPPRPPIPDDLVR